LGFSSAAEVVDPEVAIPMFIVSILPSGLVGLLLAAYFSAIMSTADSCLMAASGNISVDILKFKNSSIHRSQLVTLLIGLLSIAIAWKAEKVLAIMLSSYSVMVSAMVLPVLSIIFKWRFHATSILISMLVGGGTALAMELFGGGGAWVVPISLSTALSSAWLSRWMVNTSS
jgi:SSS family solute:Na+ symporter